jgi:nucleotide-binding universal stress UspA family protein
LNSSLHEDDGELVLEQVALRAVAERFGARVITYIVRGRSAGQAIVEEAERVGANAIVMAASTRLRTGARPLGHTVAHVMRNTPCRLILGIDPEVTP